MTTETPEFIDALAYVDTAIDEDEEKRAMAMLMVDEEMETFPPDKDYLQYLPYSDRQPFLTETMKQEYLSIENKETRENSKELSKLKTEIPPLASSRINDDEFVLWTKCLNQAKIKMEYKLRQMMNLDIMKIYGSAAWDQYLVESKEIEAELERELDDLNKRVEDVNWRRKSDQKRALDTLNILKFDLSRLIEQNSLLSGEIEIICSQIEAEEESI